MANRESIELTREALYELVWSKPTRTVAAEYGLSDVGLAKVCKRAGVPRPGLGYWAKVAHGQKPRRTPLRSPTDGQARAVIISRSEKEPRADSEASIETPAVAVCSRLVIPHPAVAAIKAVAEQSGRGVDQLVVVGGRRRSVLRVSPAALPRALRILDALAKAISDRGRAVRHAKAQEPGYSVPFDRLFASEDGHEVHFSIVEKVDKVPHEPTADEQRRRAAHGYSSTPDFDERPSGRLTLRLAGEHGLLSLPAWSDGARKKLDDQLGRVVLAVEGELESRKKRAAEAAQWRRQYEEAERRRQRERVRQEHRGALEKDLRDMAARWDEAGRVRAFLDAVSAAAGESERSDAFTAWLDWARQFAARLDPLAAGASTVAKVLEADGADDPG